MTTRERNAALIITVKGPRTSIRRKTRIDPDHLSDFLSEMRLLLNAAGFTYVRRLNADK